MRRELKRQAAKNLEKVALAAIRRGVPPSAFGYRWIARDTLDDCLARCRGSVERVETVHPEEATRNPLPCNVGSPAELPGARGWWGYSFRDVPDRVAGATVIASIPGGRVVSYRDPDRDNDFYPAILTCDNRALDLREIRFRPRHGETLRRARSEVRVARGTWITERVYHNHSHWLTAHLPKILLLRDRGTLDDVLLPPDRSAALDESLRLLGLDPGAFRTFPVDRPLVADELTVVATDRFRPELVRSVQKAYGAADAERGWRKVFISRRAAARRRLVNEADVWAVLEAEGFERVEMERLPFRDQVALMRETGVLVAPHGAGLTNMLFCPPGTDVVEIADRTFPNPNFYALASALGHRYWVLWGEPAGDGRPLDRDLRIAPSALGRVVAAALAGRVKG